MSLPLTSGRIAGLIGLLVSTLAFAAPPENGRTFEAPGATLYVEVLGTAAGVPLVVVNGGPGFDHTYQHAVVPGTTSAWETLAKFPTMVITGRYDINVAPSVAYKIHKAIPGSRFVVFERSGHLPFYEEPEAFVRALEPFLGASGGR